MTQKQRNLRMAVIGILVSLILWLGTIHSGVTTHTSSYLSVTFLDVGQGDAILIETPDGIDVLVDGGADRGIIGTLAAALGPFDRTLDLVVGTHPDLDHVGGLIPVLERYDVATLLVTEHRGETMTATAYQTALVDEAAMTHYARAGQVFQLGASTTLSVFAPARDPSLLESNAASIIIQINYGETSFMLTGDAPTGVENYLVGQYGELLQSDVLKLGHHGSDTSTSELFLDTVTPTYAVVSAGLDNRYGHPHPAVIDRVTERGITVYSTAERGTITFKSDGTTVWLAE